MELCEHCNKATYPSNFEASRNGDVAKLNCWAQAKEERSQCLSGDISGCTSRGSELRKGFITWELGNQNGIVLAHRQIPRVSYR